MIDILQSWRSLECPKCKFSNSVRLDDVSLNRRIICSGCHNYIYLVDKEVSMYRADKEINNALKEFETNLSRLSGKLKITF